MRRVLIVGGGFGGLYAARALASADAEVTVLDRRNHHLFQPLLYQVATATLNPSDIAMPIRAILRHQRNARVLLGEAVSVDLAKQEVVLGDGDRLRYDDLVLATGATHSYFGRDAWARFAPGLKSIEDALEIRRRIFLAFELAERVDDPEERRAWLTFAIIGGGPTGVELAGAVAEIAKKSLRGDFRAINPSNARVVLIEGRNRILPTSPEVLSHKAAARLEKLGVEIHTGVRATAIDEDGVSINDGTRIPARTTLWAAGVAASPLARSLGVPLDEVGRVRVEPDLSIPGHPNVHVIGDLALLMQDGQVVPGVSPAAMQEGRYVAEKIMASMEKAPIKPFRYFDKGSFAVIGRGAAVGHFLDKVKLSGFIAWLAWLFIHLYFLIGFRNRLSVLFDWAYAYLTFRQGARLITGDTHIERLKRLALPQPGEAFDVTAPAARPPVARPSP
ncbi:MAG TPA: NAD(P)/FAD-dependent oxidoreductase [Polyangia bacterium]